MRLLKNKKLIASVLVVAAIVAAALWPESMEVTVTRAERGPMQVTVDEDGETRVRDKFLVTFSLWEGRRGYDFKTESAAIVENSKKLIDTRFPRE